MQVVVNSLLTSFVRLGKGRPIVILHGWGDDSRGWQGFAQKLAASYEVVVPDLPGFGGSQPPNGVWGLDDYATFVSAFIKKLDVQPYAIIGHSNGGAIAVRAIARGDLKPDKLLLLASAGIRGEAKGRNIAWKIVAKAGKIVAAPLPASAKHKLRSKLYQAAGSDMLVAEHLQETFKRVVSQDVRQDAATLKLPTLLVYGAADTATPPHYGKLLTKVIHGSQLTILPDAGHFVQLDVQSQVVRLTEEFLR